METNPYTQPDVTAPPLLGATVSASRQAPDAVAEPSVIPLPRSPPTADDAVPQPGQSITSNPPFVPARLPAAVGPILAEALEQRWNSYRKELRRCQEEFSEEAVHELRVATRRLLAQFVLLTCVAPSTGLDKARATLKGRIAALGDLRDTQVQLSFLDHHAAQFPELEPLHAWLWRRERRLARTAARKVNRFRTRKFGKWITAMAADLAASAANVRARKQLAAAVAHATADAFAEAVERRRAIDLADLGTIHQTRVAFKRFRYIVESLSPGLTALSKRQLRALAHYQRRMGIIQDLEVMKRCVEKFVRRHKESEPSLRLFCRYLRQRRTRAVRSFLSSADHLFEFWPPARLAASGHFSRTRKAA